MVRPISIIRLSVISHTVLARSSKPPRVAKPEVCKSVRGALLYIPMFLRGGGLREIPSKDMGVAHTRGGLHERVR